MNKTIWKYPLELTDVQVIAMPRDAQILSVAVQSNMLCLWAMVEPDAPLVNRPIDIYGTGHPFVGDARSVFIGTVLMAGSSLVWHVFERQP